ncbi:hypothetical protein Vretifemale_8022, partial [Volvox reticuliferus]
SKALGWLTSHGVPSSVSLDGACAAYDRGDRMGAMSSSLKLPNSLLTWAQWQARLVTNFESCLALNTASVAIQYRSWCGWSFCTKTLYDVQMTRGSSCPPYGP